MVELKASFPENFDFYHLGTVATENQNSFPLKTISQDCLKNSTAIGFRLYGDATEWLITLFDQDLDEGLYTEMGNILASQFANRLAEERKGTVLISPPQKISTRFLEKKLQVSPPLEQRLYWHSWNQLSYPIHVLILDSESEGGEA